MMLFLKRRKCSMELSLIMVIISGINNGIKKILSQDKWTLKKIKAP